MKELPLRSLLYDAHAEAQVLLWLTLITLKCRTHGAAAGRLNIAARLVMMNVAVARSAVHSDVAEVQTLLTRGC